VTAMLLVVVGTVAAATGTALAAGAGAVSRLVLARWVSQRQHGSAVATALLSAPAKVVEPALALLAGGLVLDGLGAAALLAPLTPARTLAALIAGIPLLLAITYVVPRAAGHRWAERLVRAAAPWLERVARVAGRLVPLGAAGSGVPVRQGADVVGEDEIVVLAGVLTFTERFVREVMTPRTEIVAIDEETLARDAAVLFTESGYSRLPVYRESLDQIIGMAYVFDLLKVEPGERLPLRPVFAVPGTRRCVELLFDLQRERRQLAVVLDEFGGTAGIVTLEDLLEELVGEISDETDAGEPAELADADLLEVDGTASVQEVAGRFGVTLPGGRETVGGLLTNALGRIPRTGERVVLSGLEFDVLRASATRVERLVVRPIPSPSVIVVRG
jgi:CBS domain containing-hemolysin-like protein